MNCLLAVMRKEFRHMLRDPWSLATFTVGAALMLVAMAYIFSADIKHVPVAVLDGDRSPQSRAYLQRFANDEFFDLRYWASSHEEALEWVESGRARAAIIVPHGFAEATLRGERVPVQIIVDGTKSTTAQQIQGNAEALSVNFSVQLLERQLASAGLASGHGSQPLDLRVRALYNPNLKEVNSFLPGLMALALGMPTISVALSLAREKEQGTMEMLMATPIRRYQLLAGKVVPYLFVGLLDILFFTLVGMVTFGVPFRGRLSDLVILSSLFLLANIGIALLIASLLRSQMAALLITTFGLMMPVINMSGLLHPLYAMPPGDRRQAMFFPATHYVIIARGIFLKGVGMQVLMPHGLFLLVFGLLLSGLAAWRLKKKLA
jgi:ABC-2 type transport system permease protein